MPATHQSTRLPRPDWLTEAAWPFEVRRAEVADQQIHHLDEGSGPTLLLVHAGMWSFVWRDLVLRLRDDHRVVALDFPGSGLSSPSDEVSIRAYRELLAGFVDRLELDDVTLAVHDLGAAVGLGWAAEHPDRVGGLVVINTFGWPPEPAGLRRMLRVIGSAPVRTVNTATNLIPRLTATSYGIGRHLDDDGRKAFLGPYRTRRDVRVSFHTLMRDAVADPDLMVPVEDALRGALRDRPFLSIFGERNDPFDYQGRWAELFPHGRHEVVAEGNHFPMADAPDEVAGWIRELEQQAR